MAFCLDPEANVTFSRVIAVSEAMGVPKVKAVQALSELLHSGELEKETDPYTMSVLVRMGTKAVIIEKREASE